jgi:hypothetical protein
MTDSLPTQIIFDRNELKANDKIWYKAGDPNIQPAVIKDRRVLYNSDGTAYVEYKLTFWSSRGNWWGFWIPARWVVGLRS